MCQAVRQQGAVLHDLLPPTDMLHLIMMHPLRVQVSFYFIFLSRCAIHEINCGKTSFRRRCLLKVIKELKGTFFVNEENSVIIVQSRFIY